MIITKNNEKQLGGITGKGFRPGQSGNPKGRRLETPQQKVIRKVTKEFIKDYKAKLAAALPELSPILIAEAMKGNIPAIKEIHDRVMGKAPQDITSGGEPIAPIRLFNYIQNNEK